jgi:hypothetical protein
VFARKADDSLASFAKRIDEIVSQNAEKHACGTVVLLGGNDEVKSKLEGMAKDKKIGSVPLTISDDGEGGPAAYSINKDVAITVVVYDKNKKVTETFAFDKLDAKSQDTAIVAFCKVLGVDPPKAGDAGKDDAKKDDTKKDDAKKDDSNKKEPD